MKKITSDLSQPKTCWLLTTGEAGCFSQLKGLAERLGVGYEKKLIHLSFPWKILPGHLCPFPLLVTKFEEGRLSSPWPDLVISAGRRTVAAALGIKRASKGITKAIHIQNPLVPSKYFDAVIAPYFDACKGDNVFETFGAIHHVTSEAIQSATKKFKDRVAPLPLPRVSILLGGTSRSCRFTDENVDLLIKQLIDLNNKTGCSFLITPSSRTPKEVIDKIEKSLVHLPTFIWDRKSENPYLALLGIADFILVTSDSVSMISEACSTGKPVYIIPMQGGSKRQLRFYDDLQKKGFIKWFAGDLEKWTYTPLDETGRSVEYLRQTLFAN